MLIRLNEFGLMDVILPFLLIFSVIFAILTQIKLFAGKGEDGSKNRNIYMFLAMAIALMVVVPHVTNTYPPGGDVVEIINNSVPNVSLFIIIAISILILIGIFGIRFTPAASGSGFVTLIAMVAVFFIFGSSAGWFDFGFPPWLSFLNDPDLQAVVLVVLMFWIVISLVTGKKPEKNLWQRMEPFIGENFNK